jgi:hypothetical protein
MISDSDDFQIQTIFRFNLNSEFKNLKYQCTPGSVLLFQPTLLYDSL